MTWRDVLIVPGFLIFGYGCSALFFDIRDYYRRYLADRSEHDIQCCAEEGGGRAERKARFPQ